jgi:hypothetical protein
MRKSECINLLANIRYFAWQILFLDCMILEIIVTVPLVMV